MCARARARGHYTGTRGWYAVGTRERGWHAAGMTGGMRLACGWHAAHLVLALVEAADLADDEWGITLEEGPLSLPHLCHVAREVRVLEIGLIEDAGPVCEAAIYTHRARVGWGGALDLDLVALPW